MVRGTVKQIVLGESRPAKEKHGGETFFQPSLGRSWGGGVVGVGEREGGGSGGGGGRGTKSFLKI